MSNQPVPNRGTRGRLAVFALLSFAALSCSDQRIDPTGPAIPARPRFSQSPPPTQALSWLAPLGTAVANAATFDANVGPRIEICVWVSNACNGAPVATFPGSGPIAVNTAESRYEASWNLLNPAFTVRRTYRIRVLIGSTETGAISVDAVRGRWALTRSDGTLAPLASANALPIRFHIAATTCVNTNSCAAQVVPATIPTGQSVTVLTNDNRHRITFVGGPNGQWNTQGIPAIVTVEDVSTQLGGTPTGCAQGITKMVVQGDCIKITTTPAVILAATAIVCMTIESFETEWQLLKFDAGQPPRVKFLPDPPARACPVAEPAPPPGGGSPLRRVGSLIGRAIRDYFAPKTAYAFDLGVGGVLLSGDEFSYFAPGLPAQLEIVSGNDIVGVAGAPLGPRQVVRVMNTHHQEPIGGAIVTCAVTGGGGSLPPGDFPGRAVENPTGTYTCPIWTLGSSASANLLRVTANIIDDFVPGGAVTFTATGAGGCGLECPNPNLAYTSSEQYSVLGDLFDRYSFEITNRSAYPASLFEPRPGATECISKTRVDFHNAATNEYIYGFCGITSVNELANLWFATPRWVSPPAAVYARFIDQTTGAVLVTSNTVQLYGPLFTNFPRVVQLNWAPIANAAAYTVQVQFCPTFNSLPDWRNCSLEWTAPSTVTVQAPTTSHTHTFVGDQTGRWRFIAIDVAGNQAFTSEYKYFNYRTSP